MVNVCFWFIIKPTDEKDPIKTIVTSMAAVLTTSMTLRIILSVRGSLENGGGYASSASSGTSTHQTHGISAVRSGNHPTNISTQPNQTYALGEFSKAGPEWNGDDAKSSVPDDDGAFKSANLVSTPSGEPGVKVTVDREVGYEPDEFSRK